MANVRPELEPLERRVVPSRPARRWGIPPQPPPPADTVSGATWGPPGRPVTVTVFVDPSLPPDQAAAVPGVLAYLDGLSGLDFVLTADPQAQVVIDALASSPRGLSALTTVFVTGQTFVLPQDGKTLHQEVAARVDVFENFQEWAGPAGLPVPPGEQDFRTVSGHELAGVMGLAEVNNTSGNYTLQSSSAPPDAANRVLSPAAKGELRWLYGAPSP